MSDTPPPRKQVNVRLPLDLIARIDARRARKDMSRDAWVEKALEFALHAQETAAAVSTAPGRRTVRRP